MPYIKPKARQEFIDAAMELACKIECAGDLNYVVSIIMNIYIQRKSESYATINELIGALECAKLELYRRVAAPYEDFKMKENGDVYD
jgi:hypothetical protein